MSLFGLGEKYKTGVTVDNAKDAYIDPNVRDKEASVVYSVGVTDDSRISLSVGNGYSSNTLFMNVVAVKNMIHMLEAAIESFGHLDDETEGENS